MCFPSSPDVSLDLKLGKQNFIPHMGIQDIPGFRIIRRVFRIPGTGFWITVVRGIQIPWSVFQIPKSRILDSTRNISHILDFNKKNFPDSESRFQGSPIGFFNPVIPIQSFVQSHNPDGYFLHLTSSARTFNPKTRPNCAVKSRIPSFK